MSTQRAAFLTPEQYLEIERKAAHKSEYYRGEMFAMAGGSRKHALIVTNLVARLSQRLQSRPCEVYSSDLRLRVSDTGLYTYPDVSVVCSEPQFADDQKDTLTNPSLVIQVLSESTKNYDRGEKFEQYRRLSSLREYVTVAQDRPHVERYRRDADRWMLSEFRDLGQIIELASVEVMLPLSEIYAKVEFGR